MILTIWTFCQIDADLETEIMFISFWLAVLSHLESTACYILYWNTYSVKSPPFLLYIKKNLVDNNIPLEILSISPLMVKLYPLQRPAEVVYFGSCKRLPWVVSCLCYELISSQKNWNQTKIKQMETFHKCNLPFYLKFHYTVMLQRLFEVFGPNRNS